MSVTIYRADEVAPITDIERMLVEIDTVEDAVIVRQAAAAAKEVAKRAGLSLEEQNRAATAKLVAEREGGQLLAGLERARGKHQDPETGKYHSSSDGQMDSPYAAALEAAGLSRQDAARWQKLASFDEERFAELIEECRESKKEITTGYLLRAWRREKKNERAHGPTLRLAHFQDVLDLGIDFGTVYADPPWRYGNQSTRGATGDHYEGMTPAQIAALPVKKTVADSAHLHLWTTNAFLFEAREVIEAWGFEYKSCFVWAKPQIGMGNYWRVSHEFLLLGVRGGLRFAERDERSWQEWRRGKHSAKPGQLYPIIERVSPSPYLEMFARRQREGWVSWGNEIENNLFFQQGAA